MIEFQMNVSMTLKAPLICAVIFMSACSSQLRYPAIPQTGLARTPEITLDSSSATASMDITVLIYNVAGLPWPIGCGKKSRTTDESGKLIPIACNRSAAAKKIGDALGSLRKKGVEPDIVMLQEAFISAAAEIPARGGYPNWVAGPGARDLGPKYSARASAEFIAERSFWKGEKLGKRQSSGLLLASNFPVIELYNHPFNQWECAGFDCLANKGLLAVLLEIPGLPDYLAVATTHFNSRGASGVSGERSLVAHNLQVAETNEYLENLDEDEVPFIWGGDINMRHADDRILYFVNRSGGTLNEVSSYCVKPGSDCEVPIHWDSDKPWYETQDLQGWVPGTRINIKPFRAETVFDEPVDGIMLSDHNGLLVHYRLSWTVNEE